MRIIGGTFSGRRIIAPKGDTARPTTDRTRESLFNILSHGQGFTFEGARVIDVFAGSGALGLEALSRGAAFCLFVEIDAKARGAIRDNIEALELYGVTRLHRRSAISLGHKPSNLISPFCLAFLDPPYRKGLVPPALEALRDGGWLTPGALTIVEQANDEPELSVAGYARADQRLFSDTRIDMFLFEG